MANVNNTQDFFKAMKRACVLSKDDCSGCPFENCTKAPFNAYSCQDFIMSHTKEAIDLLQKFDDAHPQTTLLTKFKKEHPDAPLWNGVPGCDPIVLGYLPETMRDYVNSLGEKIWLVPVEDIEKCATVSSNLKKTSVNKEKAEKKNSATLFINGKEVSISDDEADIINDILSQKKTSTRNAADVTSDMIKVLNYLLG